MINSEQRLLQFAPTSAVRPGRGWMGLQIDHRQFLDALQEEWLCPPADQRGRMLGIESFAKEQKEPGEKPSSLIAVNLCFDLRLLPKLLVLAWSSGTWQEVRSDSMPSDIERVFWPGAIPLFAVTRIVINSEEERTRLFGLARHVSNVSMPEAVIEVREASVHDNDGVAIPKVSPRGISISQEYGLVRGATTMAVWAIPRVDPWFDLLVASLSKDLTQLTASAKAVAVPWYAEAPWIRNFAESPCDTFDCRLWRAALRTLLEGHREGGIDATSAVERVHKYAVGSTRSPDADAEKWREQTLSVLRGKEDFRLDDWKQCPVGKALQIMLLRPEPEHFAKWLQDLPGIPPPIWFSAATLCGYLHGYRSLATTFRGSAVQRRTLSTHALTVATDRPEGVDWPFPGTAQLAWRKENNEFVLMCGGFEFARKAAYPRTLWHNADLDDPLSRRAAEELARRLRWNCFTRRVQLSNASIPFTSQSTGKMSIEGGCIVVQGSVEFVLPEPASVAESFDVSAFRKCMAVEGAPNIPAPPIKERTRYAEETPAQPLHDNGRSHSDPSIQGLLLIDDFLTPVEEADIVAQIDATDWREDLKRRVQHYGWRYDYKARQVKKEMYLGPLPAWAAKLADRLVRQKLLPHVPDQVIVNEYQGKQGISKHVDCKPCFEDGIAMVSLLESWEMNFTRGREKRAVLLPRRSVAVLNGEARYQWTHEIPKRAIEPSGLRRERRISITFRKVIVGDAKDRPPQRKSSFRRSQ